MRWLVLALVAVVAGLFLYAVYPYVLSLLGRDVSTSQICIENRSGQTLIVTAEADEGNRMSGSLNDGDRLCVPSPNANSTGKVRVFESEDAVEGCSRLARAEKVERLLSYSSFDNCEWDEG